MKKKYISSERVELFEPNVLIHLSVEVIGDPSETELINAVNTAIYANEVTMSKIKLEENGTAYYERIDESRNTVTVTTKKQDELIKENERIPFKIDEGELIRVFIIKGEGKLILHIMAHHLAGDGKSMVYFLEDIMHSLAGMQIAYKPIVLLNDESLPKVCKLSFLEKAYANSFNRKWNKTGRSFTFHEYYAMYEKYWENNQSVIKKQVFSIEETKALIEKAKSVGVSLNSLIIAALLKANPKNKSVGIAVNGRMDNNRSMSNQATGISVHISYSNKKTIEENARIFHKKVRIKLDNVSKKYFVLKFMPYLKPTLIDSILMHINSCYENKTSEKLAKVLGYKGQKTKALSVTNLTKLDILTVYGKYEIKNCVFIPPVVSHGKRIFGIVTLSDVLVITYHYMNHSDLENAFFDQAIDNILDLIK